MVAMAGYTVRRRNFIAGAKEMAQIRCNFHPSKDWIVFDHGKEITFKTKMEANHYRSERRREIALEYYFRGCHSIRSKATRYQANFLETSI